MCWGAILLACVRALAAKAQKKSPGRAGANQPGRKHWLLEEDFCLLIHRILLVRFAAFNRQKRLYVVG